MTIATIELQRPVRSAPPGTSLDVYVPQGVDLQLAAESVNLRNQRDKDRLSGVLLHARVTGGAAWRWFNRISEVHFALTRAAKIAGYADVHAVRKTPKGDVEEIIESGPAHDAIQSLYSRIGGTRGLIERYFLHQKITGESHLIRWMDGRSQDGYQFASSRELDDGNTAAGIAIENRAKAFGLKMTTMPNVANLNGAFEKTIAQKDYIGRVWSPSPEWLDVPESPLGALDKPCDMLDTMTRNMHAAMKSRFAMAGIMYFSNKVREAFGGQKENVGKTTLEILYALMTHNMAHAEDTADVRSILPILMMGEAEPGKVMEHLTIDREIFEQDLKLRGELIDRILFGLDINAPATEGNKDTSHWGAWQNSADELRLAVIPDLEGYCWTADRLVMRPAITESKDAKLIADMNKGLIGVAFELDEASVRANRASDARELRKQGLLSELSTAKAGGFTENDLMDAIEYVRWVGVQLRIPEMATWGKANDKTVADITDAEWERWMPQKTGAIGNGGDTGPMEPGKGDPGSPDSDDSDTPKSKKPI